MKCPKKHVKGIFSRDGILSDSEHKKVGYFKKARDQF